MNPIRKNSWTLPVIAFGLGMVAMYWGQTFLLPTYAASSPTDRSQVSSNYSFINPLLFCQDQGLSKLTSATSKKIESEVEEYIEEKKNGGKLADAAVYFRDLNAGPWALVNGELLSAPSSLLKVPMAISIYKHADSKPEFLNQTLRFGGGEDPDQEQYFSPIEHIQAGFTYSVEELVRFMVVDSDNAALYLLSSQLSSQELIDLYNKFGIDPPLVGKNGYQMDVRTYASFFRTLFNASYLDQDQSEHLLSLLAQSTFTKGLPSGIPQGIPVAHKFGEAKFASGALQLHDCGIIYKPASPYLLCVMTHGNDYEAQAKNIADISRIIWNILK